MMKGYKMKARSSVNQRGSVEVKEENRDDNAIVSSIQGKICIKSPLPAKCCIFRVPDILRKPNKKVFVPELISIGPFHHGKKKLQAMEKIKLWYLHCLLNRAPTQETSLESFVKAIGSLEKDSRECYAEEIRFSGEKFVEMMVVDGCFIIEFFRKYAEKVPRDKDDPVFNASWMIPQIATELLLLENQLPWCVLNCLFDMTNDKKTTISLAKLAIVTLAAVSFGALTLPIDVSFGELAPPSDVSLVDLVPSAAVSFSFGELAPSPNVSFGAPSANVSFSELAPSANVSFSELAPSADVSFGAPSANISFSELAPSANVSFSELAPLTSEYLHPSNNLKNKHLLDFLRNCFLGSYAYKDPERERVTSWLDHIPSVTELLQAGVKFKKLENNVGVGVLDITFDNGVMAIPQIFVWENTETLLRNLVAFEQCDISCMYKITSYIMLLDNLINNGKDVDFLIEQNIVHISNSLNTEDTARFFNRLTDNTGFTHYLYKDLYSRVNAHYKGRWNRWRAILKGKYFNNPWSISSFIAAIIILLLTFLQTFYSMLSYKY